MNRTLHFPVVLLLAACARAGGGDGASTDSTMARGDSPTVRQVDSTVAPVIITLRRDSLGLGQQASMQEVTARVEAVLPRLRSVADFDLLAVSPAILALNVRPKAPMTPDNFMAALRTHPLVSSIERSGIQRIP